jgi:hypothetical protein
LSPQVSLFGHEVLTTNHVPEWSAACQPGNRTIPIVVRFDRGNGSEFVAKAVPFSIGNAQVGVNATDNLRDLFPTNENRREVSDVRPFKTDNLRKR